MPLPVWLSGPMFLLVRPLSLAMFLPGVSGGSLSKGVSLQGVSRLRPPLDRLPPPSPNQKSILPESFLVKGSFTLNDGNGNDIVAVPWVAWYAMKVFTLGGRQQQRHRHGMGWIPICDGNGNGNPFDCMHFAVAVAIDTPQCEHFQRFRCRCHCSV